MYESFASMPGSIRVGMGPEFAQLLSIIKNHVLPVIFGL
jgi:hypothetical protein